jgi:hypothetical protein
VLRKQGQISENNLQNPETSVRKRRFYSKWVIYSKFTVIPEPTARSGVPGVSPGRAY